MPIGVYLHRSKPLADRFWTKVEKSDGCWLWTATTSVGGYGQIAVDGRIRGAHRVAYELLVGPIPADRELDHLCRNPSCVNPEHLEPVTHRENIMRGDSPSSRHARLTHCIRGHEYAGSNLYVTPGGARHCRACRALLRGAA